MTRLEKCLKTWKKEAKLPYRFHYRVNYTPSAELTIYVALPGYLVGRGGALIDKYRDILLHEHHISEIKFVEVSSVSI